MDYLIKIMFERKSQFHEKYPLKRVLVKYTKGTNTPTLTPSHDFLSNLWLVFYTKLLLWRQPCQNYLELHIIHLITQRVQQYIYSFYIVLQKFREIKQSFESSVLVLASFYSRKNFSWNQIIHTLKVKDSAFLLF